MVVKCGICGEVVEVSGALSDGVEILCPVCGETSIYRKPTRIEIPATKMEQERLSQKTKLKVIRPSDQSAEKIIPTSPTYEQLRMSLQSNTQQRCKNGGLSSGLIVALALVVTGGTLYWLKTRHTIEHEMEMFQAAEADTSRYRATREQEENECRAAREAKAAKEKAERDAAREQRRMEREAELAARKEKAELEKLNRDRFAEIEQQFRESHLVFASDFKEDKHPIRNDGNVFSINFKYLTDRKIFEAMVENCDITAVRVLSLLEEPKDVDVKCFKEMLSKEKGLIKSDNGPVWIYGTGVNHWTEKASVVGDEITPSKKELGELYPLLKRMGIMPDLKFRLTLKPKDGGNATVMGIIGYSESMSRDKIREFVVKAISARRVKSVNIKEPRFKKFTPTVVFYDGDIIRKEMRVTKVPRTFTHLGTKYYGTVKASTYYQAEKQWVELKNEAERKKRKQREVRENNDRLMQEYNDKVKTIISKPITGEEIEAECAKYILVIERSRSRLESKEN